MKPAEKVALLTALIEGATAELAFAKAEALAVAEAVGVKSFATPFGSVTVAARDAKPMVTDDAAVLAYVAEAFPTEVETIRRVRPSFLTALLGRLEWDADHGQFIDTKSGEGVPGVEWGEPGQPYITWPSGDLQKLTKTEAAEWFHGRTEELLGAMAQIEPAKKAS